MPAHPIATINVRAETGAGLALKVTMAPISSAMPVSSAANVVVSDRRRPPRKVTMANPINIAPITLSNTP